MAILTKIIHLTDLHLRASGGRVLGIDPEERLRIVIRSINENHADAACCILTGDIADAGEVGAYEIARHHLAELKIPFHTTLGNHDSRSNYLQIFPKSPVSDGGFLQCAVDLGALACIVMDTLDEDHPGQGVLCPKRITWLRTELNRLAHKPVVIFMHHPPLSIGLDWFDQMLIANGAELMSEISMYKNVIHLAFGHVHVNTSGNWRGASFSGSRGTCHKILFTSNGQYVEYVDQGAAYNLLLVGNNGVHVHSIDPAGNNLLIAREHPTADDKGSYEVLRDLKNERWM